MKHTAVLLLTLLSATAFAQRISLGVEGGLYALTTDKVGVATLDKATCFTYGLVGRYYYSDRVTINSGFSTGKFDIWSNGRYFRVPLTLSYSPTNRGQLRAKEPNRQSLVYLLSLGFIPQTLEFDGGLSFGFYNGVYTNKSIISVTTISTGNPASANFVIYSMEQRNARFVPSVDLGIRWTLDMNQAHLSINPRYSFLLVHDNLVRIENMVTHEVTNGHSRGGFYMTIALTYTL